MKALLSGHLGRQEYQNYVHHAPEADGGKSGFLNRFGP